MLLIDGHNVIGRAPGLSLDDEGRSREVLLRRIAASRGGRVEPVVVVFDGNRPGSAKETRLGGVKVVYAPAGRSADDEILRRLSATNPRAVTVVTSDRGLASRARDLGARSETAEGFLQRLGKRRQGACREGAKPEPAPEDVEAWLELFGSGGRRPGKHNM